MGREKELKKELEQMEKVLRQKLKNKEIDVEEAMDQYFEKRLDIENKIEELARHNGKYREKIFKENIEALGEIESGVISKVRIDIHNMEPEELLFENVKDLRSVRKEVGGRLGGFTRWMKKWKGGHPLSRLQARYFQAITKLLTISVRQNQRIIQQLDKVIEGNK